MTSYWLLKPSTKWEGARSADRQSKHDHPADRQGDIEPHINQEEQIRHVCSLRRLAQDCRHVGLDGNELADEYAKLGTIDDSTQLATQTTGKEIKAATREYVYHKWKEKWKALKKYRMTKVVARLSRTDMTLFIHAITGHNNLNYMNSIIIPDYIPLCRFCEEEDESFQHLYEDCPVFWKQRREIQKDRIGTENWTVQTVLKMAKIEDILEAMQTNITEEKMKTTRT